MTRVMHLDISNIAVHEKEKKMKKELKKALEVIEAECKKYDDCQECSLLLEVKNSGKKECFFDLFFPEDFSLVIKEEE